MGKFSCLESIQGCIEQLTNGHNTVDMKKIYCNLCSYYLSINQSILCSCNYVCNETKKKNFCSSASFQCFTKSTDICFDRVKLCVTSWLIDIMETSNLAREERAWQALAMAQLPLVRREKYQQVCK